MTARLADAGATATMVFAIAPDVATAVAFFTEPPAVRRWRTWTLWFVSVVRLPVGRNYGGHIIA